MATARKPRILKAPQPCRYCGAIAIDHAREGLPQCVSYSCRNVEECGERIREAKAARGETTRPDDLPF